MLSSSTVFHFLLHAPFLLPSCFDACFFRTHKLPPPHSSQTELLHTLLPIIMSHYSNNPSGSPPNDRPRADMTGDVNQRLIASSISSLGGTSSPVFRAAEQNLMMQSLSSQLSAYTNNNPSLASFSLQQQQGQHRQPQHLFQPNNSNWMMAAVANKQGQDSRNAEMLALLRAKASLVSQQQPPSKEATVTTKSSPLVNNKPAASDAIPPRKGLASKKKKLAKKGSKSKADKKLSSSKKSSGKRRKKGDKPSDMPRRALSAYNIFFSEQRQKILKELDGGEEEESKDQEEDKKERPSVLDRTFFPVRKKRAHRKVHGKIGLVSLARTVSQRWKELPDKERKYFQDLAEQDRERHKLAMIEYQDRKAAEAAQGILSLKSDASSSSYDDDDDASTNSAHNAASNDTGSGRASMFSSNEAVEEGMRLAIMQQEYQRRLMMADQQLAILRMRQQQQQLQQQQQRLSNAMFLQGNINRNVNMNVSSMGLQQMQRNMNSSTTGGFPNNMNMNVDMMAIVQQRQQELQRNSYNSMGGTGFLPHRHQQNQNHGGGSGSSSNDNNGSF